MDAEHEKKRIWEAVVYGSISVTVVSLLSLGGAVLAPLLKKKTKYRWLHFFVAMAVATLSADAILHIIPQVAGVHSHSHGDGHAHGHSHEHHHDHEHDHDHHDHHNETAEDHHSEKRDADEHSHEDITWLTITDERRILLRLSIIVATIYFLYFAEFVIFNRNNPPKQLSDSSSLESCEDTEPNNNSENTEKDKEDRSQCGHELVSIKETNDDDRRILGLKPRAFIILFGDGVHNLVDGIAIGASFLISARLGFITTIAVVCHELPHEIGDLAVLVDSGLSMCKALILNLLSALTAYIGLYLSIFLGKNEGAEIILLAITAGMFLYVAWVDMLAHLKHDVSSNDKWYVTFAVQFFGFLVGFLLIFALGWFEENFQ